MIIGVDCTGTGEGSLTLSPTVRLEIGISDLSHFLLTYHKPLFCLKSVTGILKLNTDSGLAMRLLKSSHTLAYTATTYSESPKILTHVLINIFSVFEAYFDLAIYFRCQSHAPDLCHAYSSVS